LALALAGKRRSFLDNRHGVAFLRKHLGERRIEHAPIPLSIIATDLGTGRPFILESGDVVSAIVASSAFPGVFPPVEIDGHTLIDGGVVADVPLDVAADLGMASVIVITVPPLAAAPAPQHPLGVVLRSSTWGVEAHGRTMVARPPNGLRVVEIPTQPSPVTTFAVGSAAATIEGAREYTERWLREDESGVVGTL
jgi:NTE family protein